MDCVENCGYNNLTLSRIVARVFSLKHSSTSISNVGIYSVGRDSGYQKWQIGKTECFAGMSREGLTCETLAKTSCHHPVLTLRIPVMCRAHALLRGKLTRKMPSKTALVFNCLESSHSLSLSHTQPLQINSTWNIGYIRLNKITIKFGTELKPT